MDDSRVFDSNVLNEDDEWGGVDFMNLEAPSKWRYDEKSGRLHMLFQDGKTHRLICSSAQMEKEKEFYRIATLASSQQVLLWYTNETSKLDASMKRN
ncbi:hypothetical protein IKG07_02240 [Candidatus Saccharibacteria bacterium]|nr:hypothetical protein [Candidatus Saccharibacteria bacterium]